MHVVMGSHGISLRNDLGNMSMSINTSSLVAQSYFDQGLRFTSAFKFDYAVQSHIAALRLDPKCAMCEWGLAMAYGQNLNDAVVMPLEPWFLENEPLAYQAIGRAQALLFPPEGGGEGSDDDSGGSNVGSIGNVGVSTTGSIEQEEEQEDIKQEGDVSSRSASPSSPAVRASAPGDSSSERDRALVAALALKFVATVEEYKSHFVNGLPASLNLAYAEAMADAAVRSGEEGWPDHPMVLLFAADAFMNLSPWDYWESPTVMRPNARKAKALLEDAMARDPENPWAIHLFTHLMEAGGDAGAAVVPAQKLQYLVPGAPHLQHMQSHVEFRTGKWHEASQANLRAVALPDSDASYPDHNMDMLMWALGVEGRRTESRTIGQRLTAYATPRVERGILAPLLPPERYLAQEALHLCAFADWEGVLALDPPPEKADFAMAVYHYARSLAFVDAKDWDSFRREQGLITAGMQRMEERTAYYGIYNACVLTKILDTLSRAEGLRGGIGVYKDSIAAGATTSAGASRSASARELELLRQAVRMEEALGYDEPPALPVPTKMFLAAALLRGNVSGSNDNIGVRNNSRIAGGAMAKATSSSATTVALGAGNGTAEEAEAVLRELDIMYPNMGRTLLGLWRACLALGKNDEAREFHQRFLASWQHSEVWLVDSAHVGGVAVSGEQPHVEESSARDAVANGHDGGGDDADGVTSLPPGSVRAQQNGDSVPGHHGSATVGAAKVELEEEGGSAEPGQSDKLATGTIVGLITGAVAVLSLAAIAVVAAMRKTRGCSGGGSSKLPWEQHLVGALESDGTASTAQAQSLPWTSGARRNGYQTIEE